MAATSSAAFYKAQSLDEKVILPSDVKVHPEHILVQKLVPDAEWPTKEDQVMSCYDITLTSRTDGRAEDDVQRVNGFHTGLRLCPPLGFHFEIVATDSLHKQGYLLAQGVKVIEPNDRDEVVVDLFKFKEGNDLELPFKAVKLRVVRTEYANIKSAVESVQLPPTGSVRRKPAYNRPQFEEEEEAVPQRRKKAANHFF